MAERFTKCNKTETGSCGNNCPIFNHMINLAKNVPYQNAVDYIAAKWCPPNTEPEIETTQNKDGVVTEVKIEGQVVKSVVK